MACTNAMTTPKLEHQMDTLQDYYMVARHVPMPARPSNSLDEKLVGIRGRTRCACHGMQTVLGTKRPSVRMAFWYLALGRSAAASGISSLKGGNTVIHRIRG